MEGLAEEEPVVEGVARGRKMCDFNPQIVMGNSCDCDKICLHLLLSYDIF